MSKVLRKNAAKLERDATRQAETIRRVVREYTETTRYKTGPYRLQREKEREIEHFVGEYWRLHKSLKRLRKKLV